MTETGTSAHERRTTTPRPPTGTARVQLTPDEGFAVATERVPYYASLGVSHLYLSPVLQAAPGSTHGYDVVDHDRVSEALGGRAGLERLAEVARSAGLGLLVDVVPNHMAVPVPAWHNRALWSVLREGTGSPFASWFDIDWATSGLSLLMPVLGDPIGRVLDQGQITLDTDTDIDDGAPVVRYFDHVFPVRPGTEHLPLEQLLDQQWYRLAWWRIADEELNYRRFFDVDSLAGLRTERPEVFEATHRLTLDLVRSGIVDGLRIDHPDGLTDPDRYLTRLAAAVPEAWVVVEKILAHDEELPASWPCAGTTGYEALAAVNGLFIDPTGHRLLAASYAERTGADLRFATTATAAKEEVLATVLAAEVERLVDLAHRICDADIRLHDHSRRALHEAIVALVVAVEPYRIYVRPEHAQPADPHAGALMADAVERAGSRLPEHRLGTLDLVAELALRSRDDTALHVEFCTRFQQTTVSATAKGVEDTALYRWMPLLGANEVGGEPSDPATSPDAFHAFCRRTHTTHPGTMTTLSTHDTKRGEDTRARLAVLSEVPDRWSEAVEEWHRATAGLQTALGPDRIDEELVWQTLVGLWPTPATDTGGGSTDPDALVHRVSAYLVKALREAKRHTSWVEPDEGYEGATVTFAAAVIRDGAMRERIDGFLAEIASAARVNTLGQKLVQLTMPGVPDVYQGAEVEWLAVVDPDNRRPLDHRQLAAMLEHLDSGGRPRHLGEEKLLVTATALRLRRDHPGWFDARGDYEALMTSTDQVLAFVRGARVAVVVTRLAAGGADLAGATVALPPGRWTNLLAAGTVVESDGNPTPAERLVGPLPVALLVGGPDGAPR